MTASSTSRLSPGGRFRAALEAQRPLPILGTINAYTAMMAQRVGHQAIYLSGGGRPKEALATPP
ncbi:methylisocitrate lyase, partial [Guyparkeria sp. 1SP6A2]|nr:methylisocitrate lyase [Guyparkeria sp. 1SP6A2]